jgi:hypothetical protein
MREANNSGEEHLQCDRNRSVGTSELNQKLNLINSIVKYSQGLT